MIWFLKKKEKQILTSCSLLTSSVKYSIAPCTATCPPGGIFKRDLFHKEQILMKSILRLAEMSNLSALSILFVSVLNEVVVSFLGYIIWVETRSCSYIPRNFLSNLVFVDGMIVPKIGSIDAACPVNYVRNCFEQQSE